MCYGNEYGDLKSRGYQVHPKCRESEPSQPSPEKIVESLNAVSRLVNSAPARLEKLRQSNDEFIIGDAIARSTGNLSLGNSVRKYIAKPSLENKQLVRDEAIKFVGEKIPGETIIPFNFDSYK